MPNDRKLRYDSLRAEIIHIQSQIFQFIRFALGSSLLIYAWAATNTIGINNEAEPCARFSASITVFLWVMPAPLAFISGILTDRAIRHINNIGDYLEKLDDIFLKSSLGWHKSSQHVPMREFGHFFNTLCWSAIIVLFIGITIGALNYSTSLNSC
jgi:hypothetical protein